MIDNLPIYNQGTTQRLAWSMTDESGAAIPTASLTTLTATLYVRKTGTIINSRDNESIKNTNGGTYADGAATLTLEPDDSPHTGQSTIEEHILLLRWTYNAGAQAGSEEILLRVRDVGHV